MGCPYTILRFGVLRLDSALRRAKLDEWGAEPSGWLWVALCGAGWRFKARIWMGNGRWRDRAPKRSPSFAKATAGRQASALHKKPHAPCDRRVGLEGWLIFRGRVTCGDGVQTADPQSTDFPLPAFNGYSGLKAQFTDSVWGLLLRFILL